MKVPVVDVLLDDGMRAMDARHVAKVRYGNNDDGRKFFVLGFHETELALGYWLSRRCRLKNIGSLFGPVSSTHSSPPYRSRVTQDGIKASHNESPNKSPDVIQVFPQFYTLCV